MVPKNKIRVSHFSLKLCVFMLVSISYDDDNAVVFVRERDLLMGGGGWLRSSRLSVDFSVVYLSIGRHAKELADHA